ncbi:GNAT family N-acetyltransferase [Ruminococcus sp. AF42-9BH]|mgnify:FL=1|jgi:GNAT superfamily N-acetyltransferase|uniref:Acetyltransferase domain containing protein n=1 Tax=Siphoviridae sp. ctRon5 TaxID=2825505 RepID=A0A8S5U069_9CAUD|nr:GNAT family N-acetyltransferase [Ruminococcus sp. AF42-9BH]DAF87857.1 MAG TPA: acetyltransferase domain containing protein [Siphoviridae sp. ctRon5]
MNFRITKDGKQSDIDEIYEMLKSYNLSNREASENIPLGVYYEDESERKLAGLTGETFGNWLCINYLFVAENLRNKGIGTKIVLSAEDEARKRNCKYVFVDTFSFQAPKFYEKLGYKEVFSLNEYPYTGKRHYYIKKL